MSTGLSGFKAEELLRTRFGIVAEMADLNNIVLITTPFHISEDFDKLLMALKTISEEYSAEKTNIEIHIGRKIFHAYCPSEKSFI